MSGASGFYLSTGRSDTPSPPKLEDVVGKLLYFIDKFDTAELAMLQSATGYDERMLTEALAYMVRHGMCNESPPYALTDFGRKARYLVQQ